MSSIAVQERVLAGAFAMLSGAASAAVYSNAEMSKANSATMTAASIVQHFTARNVIILYIRDCVLLL